MSKKATATAPAIDAETKPFVEEWRQITAWLETAKARELELRNLLAQKFFPAPTEGANRVITTDGFEFVLDFKINRKLDEAALDAVMSELPVESPFRRLGVLVAYKPTLVLKGFRAMPEDQKLIFAQALTETPGTPALAINEVSDAMDPATASATPDWPATQQAATPIMDAYEAEKAKAGAKPKTATGKAAKKGAKAAK